MLVIVELLVVTGRTSVVRDVVPVLLAHVLHIISALPLALELARLGGPLARLVDGHDGSALRRLLAYLGRRLEAENVLLDLVICHALLLCRGDFVLLQVRIFVFQSPVIARQPRLRRLFILSVEQRFADSARAVVCPVVEPVDSVGVETLLFSMRARLDLASAHIVVLSSEGSAMRPALFDSEPRVCTELGTSLGFSFAVFVLPLAPLTSIGRFRSLNLVAF